jgi:hypothetical protein
MQPLVHQEGELTKREHKVCVFFLPLFPSHSGLLTISFSFSKFFSWKKS